MSKSASTDFHIIRHLPPHPDAALAAYGHEEIQLVTEHELVVDRLKAVAAVLPAQAHWHISPTPRTRLTGEMLRGAGKDLDPASIVEDVEFIEQRFGAFAGNLFTILREREDYRAYAADPINTRPPGGESFNDIFNRVGTRLDAVAAKPGPHIIVTHGGVVRAAVAYALKVPLTSILSGLEVLPLAHIHMAATEKSGHISWKLRGITHGPDFRIDHVSPLGYA